MVRWCRAGLLPLSLLAAVALLLAGCASPAPAHPAAKVVKAARDITLPTLITESSSGNVVCQASGSIPELAKTYPGFSGESHWSFQWAQKEWTAASRAGATDSFRQSASPSRISGPAEGTEGSGCTLGAQEQGWAVSVFLFKDAAAAASFLPKAKPGHSGAPPYQQGPVAPASGLGEGAWTFTDTSSPLGPSGVEPEPNTWAFARMNVVAMFQTYNDTPSPTVLAQDIYSEIARAAS